MAQNNPSNGEDGEGYPYGPGYFGGGFGPVFLGGVGTGYHEQGYRPQYGPGRHFTGYGEGGYGSGTFGGGYGSSSFMGYSQAGHETSDEALENRVADALDTNPMTGNADIDVSSQHGVVTLTGVVQSKHIKRLADHLAWSVPGVHDVQNQLRVKGRMPHRQTQAAGQSG
jgi:hypothetical protein